MFLSTTYDQDGNTIQPKEGVQKIKSLGFDYAILVDDSFSAVPDFYMECKKNNIKPIIGLSINSNNLDFALVCKNKKGYKSVSSLVSAERFNVNTLFNDEDVDIIVYNYKHEKDLKEIFKKGSNVYGGFKKGDSPEDSKKIEKIWELCPEDRLIPFYRPTHLEVNDFDGVRGIRAIKKGLSLYAVPKTQFKNSHIHNPLNDKIGNKTIGNVVPSLSTNINNLAKNSIDDYDFGKPVPPNFMHTAEVVADYQKRGLLDASKTYTQYQLLEAISISGLKAKGIDINDPSKIEYKERLTKELEVIEEMDFSGYILIVWDIVLHLSKLGINVGPGRGSGAGSLILFSVDITEVDPMPYGLLFERFLNPERISMPDIDLDIPQHHSKMVLDFIKARYGNDFVSQIPSFDKIRAKQSINDAVKMLDFPEACAKSLSSLIEKGEDLSAAYEARDLDIESVLDYHGAEKVWYYAGKMENCIRNRNVHPAGVIISDTPISDKNAKMKVGETETIQFEGKHTEFGDLVKFDFLNLKILSIMEKTVSLIKERTGREILLKDLPLNDPSVYKYISEKPLEGIFQIESKGMQDLCKSLAPSGFEELIAILSLYRPGVIESDMLDVYIKRKQGKEKVTYFSDEFTDVLTPILEKTYGIIVYQEQVMQIVTAIGGFTLAKADLVRKSMSKKDDQLKKFAKEFVKGASEKGYVEDHAMKIFKAVEKFSKYGFNKSHSAAYAMLTYRSALLKSKYPLEYMTALLSFTDKGKDHGRTMERYIQNAFQLGLKVTPPDVNKSISDFSIDESGSIVFGLSSIRGVGNKAAADIVNIRRGISSSSKNLFSGEIKAMPFSDFFDFNDRTEESDISNEAIRALIGSGSFDFDKTGRKKMLVAAGEKKIQDIHMDYTTPQKIQQEKATLGFILSDPFKHVRHILDKYEIPNFNDIPITRKNSKTPTWIFALPISVEKKINKRGNPFFNVELLYNNQTLTIFIHAHDKEAMESFSKEIGWKSDGIWTNKPLILGVEKTLGTDGNSTWVSIDSIYKDGEKKPLIFGFFPSALEKLFKPSRGNVKIPVLEEEVSLQPDPPSKIK